MNDKYTSVTTPEVNSLYFKQRQDRNSQEIGLFKTFSEVGYVEALKLCSHIKDKTTPKSVDPNIVFDLFNKQTILALAT